MTTKIIQIASLTSEDGDGILHALCDNGEIWMLIKRYSGLKWTKIPDIEQNKAISSEHEAVAFARLWNGGANDKNNIRFVAQDKQCEWVGFCGLPELTNDSWSCSEKSIRLHELQDAANALPIKNWKKTLIPVED